MKKKKGYLSLHNMTSEEHWQMINQRESMIPTQPQSRPPPNMLISAFPSSFPLSTERYQLSLSIQYCTVHTTLSLIYMTVMSHINFLKTKDLHPFEVIYSLTSVSCHLNLLNPALLQSLQTPLSSQARTRCLRTT